MKKVVLLQIYDLIYFYYGLAAIKTLYKDTIIDVIFIEPNQHKINNLKLIVKSFPEIRNVLIYTEQIHSKFIKTFKKRNSILNKIYEWLNNKPDEKSYFFKEKNYSDIFYAHELNKYIAVLKYCYPNADFTMYGDGQGWIFGQSGTPFSKKGKDYFIPSKVVALLPTDVNNFIEENNIPVIVTNPEYVISFLRRSTFINNMLKEFLSDLASDNSKPISVITTQPLTEAGLMTIEDEINMNVELIENFFLPGSIVLIKPHPRETIEKIPLYNNKLKGNYIVVEFTPSLKSLPFELMTYLIDKKSNFLLYGTTAVTFKYLFGITTPDTLPTFRKYCKYENFSEYQIVLNRIMNDLDNWDRSGLIYNRK